jgi:hypothetical protein
MSYLRNKNIFVKKILLVTINNAREVYKNIDFIMGFTYLEYKLWLIQITNRSYNTQETKLIHTDTQIITYFKIYVGSVEFLINNNQLNSIKIEDFIKEVVLDIEQDVLINLPARFSK